MGTPARLAYTNLLTVSGVVISSSSEATGYVDDNLANPMRWKKWVSTSTTGDQWVKFDLGANKQFQVLAAINAVIHPGGNLRAQANATDSWGAPTVNDLYTVPSPDFTQVLADWLSSVQNLRWIRFYFTNTGAVNAAVALGAVFAGTYLQPTRSLSDGLSVRRIDPSVQRVAIGGQRSAVVRSKYHSVSARWDLQNVTGRDNLRTVFESIGAATPAVLSLDPSDPSLTFYGALAAVLEAQDAGPDLWGMAFDFQEDVA